MRFSRRDLFFLATVLAWHAVFFGLARHWGRIHMGDTHEYVAAARNLLHHGTLYSGDLSLPFTGEEATLRTPLYPMLLAGVYAVGGNDWVVIILQSLISGLALMVARDALLRVGYNKKWDWVFLLLALSYPAQAIHAAEIEPEMALQLFTVLYFRSGLLLLLDGRPKHAAWSSLWLVIGLLTKPVLYPVVALHFLALVGWSVWKRKSLSAGRAGVLVAAACMPLLAVVAYNTWNLQRTGKWHFTSNQAFNALYYYYPFVEHRAGHDSARRFIEGERASIAALPRYADRYDHAQRRGWRLLRENAGAYLPFHIFHSARLLIDPGKADLDLFTGRLSYEKLYTATGESFSETLKTGGWSGIPAYARRNPSLPLALGVLAANLIRLGGLILFFTRRRIPRRARLLVMFFVAYFCAVTGPIAAPRYLLPVAPILIGCAAIGWGGVQSGRHSRILARRNASCFARTPAV